MYNIDFPKISEPKDIRSELIKVSQGNNNYAWLNQILDSTLDEYVEINLRKTAPKLTNYEPSFVEEHFSESTRILDRCLARRSEIFRLEALAITTALDYQFAEQVQNHDLLLSLLQVKAYRQQGLAGHNDATSDTVKAKNSLITAARETRLKMHTSKGHALNYGEQVTLLRNLYADDIISLYERAAACRIGLKNSFNINSIPLPSWTATRNTLNDLLWWFRDTIKNFEIGRMREKIITKYFLLGTDGLVPGGAKAVLDELAAAGDADFSFNITGATIPNFSRILSVGSMPTFGEDTADWTAIEAKVRANTANLASASLDLSLWSQSREEARRRRSGYSFPIGIKPPNQKTEVDLIEYSWPLDFVPIGVRGGWSANTGPLNQSFSLEPNNSFVNVNPLGEWQIRIPDEVFTPEGKIKRSDMANLSYFRLQDVAFSIRIAVRI